MNLLRNRFILIWTTVAFLSSAPGAEPIRQVESNRWTQKWQGVTKLKKTDRKINYFLPTGFVFQSQLENQIVSFNVESPAIAIIQHDIAYLDRVVIPAGTRIIGTAAIQKSHDRILVNWNTIVFPTGDEVQFHGIALSADGSMGLKGKVDEFHDQAIASSVFKSVVAGSAAAVESTTTNPVLTGAATGAAQEAINTADQQQVTVSITVSAFSSFQVYVSQRLEY